MNGVVPPVIESPKSIIGVGTRELIILGVAVFIGISVIISPMSLVLKVGLTALVLGLGALLALGRSPNTGKSFEEYFLDLWRYYRRPKYLQRGAGQPEEFPPIEALPIEEPRVEAPERERVARRSKRAVARMNPLPLSWGGFFSVLSITFLLMLIAWIWTGGLQEVLIRFGGTF